MLRKKMLFVLLMISVIGICGCAEKNNEESGLKVYTYEELDFDFQSVDRVNNVKMYGNDVYFITQKSPDYPHEYFDDLENMGIPGISDSDGQETFYKEFEDKYSEYKSKTCIWKYNLDSGEKNIVYETESRDTDICAYSIGEDDSVTMVLKLRKYSWIFDGDDRILLNKIAADGTEISSKDISEFFNQGEDLQYNVNDVRISNDGMIYADAADYNSGNTRYYKISPEGELMGTVPSYESWDGFVIDNNGNMVVKSRNNSGDYLYQVADFDTGRLQDPYSGMVDGEIQNPDYRMLGSSDTYDLLLGNSAYMYGYSKTDSTLTPILKWLDCGVVGNTITSVTSLTDGRFLCHTYHGLDDNSSICILEEDTSDPSEKKILTLTGVENSDEIQKQIVEFNRMNKEYKINYKTYDDREDPVYAMNMDIISGNAPDIIDLSGLNKENYIASGILCDLTPFMENDDVLNKDYFVDGLLDNTAVDGKQYHLIKSFVIQTIAGRASQLNQYKDNWTMKSFIEFCNSKPEDTQLFEIVFKQEIFDSLFRENNSSYINWNTGEVFFDGEEFRAFLEFCNSMPSADNADFEFDLEGGIKSGKILLDTAYIYLSEDIARTNILFDNDIEYIGYPGETGGLSYIEPGSDGSLAIIDSSEYKDGAWEFIKKVITDKTEKDSDFFPASKVEFENMVKRDMATEEYTDENGNIIKPRNTDYDGVKIGPATEEEINILRNLIKHSIVFRQRYGEIYEIVAEEAGKYFEGQKSLDDTISVLQDRMKKYVNENR